MTSHTFLHKAVVSGAIAGMLLSAFALPLAAQAPADLPPAASPAEPPSLDDLLAPPGGAVVPGESPPVVPAAIADGSFLSDPGDMEIPGTIPLTEEGVRAATAADPVTDPDMEVLTRGPVHEAYAETYNYDATPGLIVNKAPPAAIAEVPPEVRPEDKDAIWVPGYWAWDEDKMDFIWVSGCWRIPPPGNRWVPGYWTKLDDGRYQWVSGLWTATSGDLTYLPTPPTTPEIGAVSPSPGAGYFWAPGYWGWQGSRYAWNPGFWSPCYDNWVWCPPRYNWTPRGCLFIGGRWDWRLPCRGQLMAPCYFRRPSLFCGTRFYSPRVCLNNNIFSMHFWVRPNYGHYYFGNYYGGNFAGRNIHPWHSYAFKRGCGDPTFAYYQARYQKNGIDYAQRRSDWHQHFVSNVADRPAVNFREQAAFARRDGDRPDGIGRGPNGFTKPNLVATTLPAVLGDQKDREVKMTKADVRDRLDTAKVRGDIARLQGERRKFEHVAGGNSKGPKLEGPGRGGPQLGGPSGPPRIGEGDGPGREGKLPKIDNHVATKGRTGADNGLSETSTLRLSRPGGLESPRRAMGMEGKGPDLKGLGEKKLDGPPAGPRSVVSLPSTGDAKPRIQIERKAIGPEHTSATQPKVLPRITGDVRDGGKGRGPDKPLKIEVPKETRSITAGPSGGNALGRNPILDVPSRGGPKVELRIERGSEPKFEPRIAPRIDSTPREVNIQPRIESPKVNIQPRIESKPPKIERSSRGASFDGPAVQPRILSQPKPSGPSFTPRTSPSIAPKISSSPRISSGPSAAPRISSPAPRMSSPAPRISSGPSFRSSSGPKFESRGGSGGGGGGVKVGGSRKK